MEENQHFTFLAGELRKIDAPARQATCEFYRAQLEKLLTEGGWRRRRFPHLSHWKAHIYVKADERIIVYRLPGLSVDKTKDLEAQVFFETTRPIPVPFYKEQKWVTMVGRTIDVGLLLWFTKGDRPSLYGQ